MKSITIRNLVIQIDADQVTSGDEVEQAQQAIDLINGVLQREPHGLGAQIFSSGLDDSDVEGEAPADDPDWKVDKIKEMINDWGETSTAELEADCSPCVSSTGSRPNVSVLVERFSYSTCLLVTYVDELETSEEWVAYEDLSEDVLDQIYELLEPWDVDNYKTQKRCED